MPPDLSDIIKARQGGADYVYALLTGYSEPPASMKMGEGMNYNKFFPGHQIAMPQPLHDQQVTYADGTPASSNQMAKDVDDFPRLHLQARNGGAQEHGRESGAVPGLPDGPDLRGETPSLGRRGPLRRGVDDPRDDAVQPVIGIIGGSGLYDIEGLERKRWRRVDTPWGEPSDELLEGWLGGVRCLFLPRHGRGHRFRPRT